MAARAVIDSFYEKIESGAAEMFEDGASASFDGTNVQGKEAIAAELSRQGTDGAIKVTVKSFEAQSGLIDGEHIVCVLGEREQAGQASDFKEAFHLVPAADGGLLVRSVVRRTSEENGDNTHTNSTSESADAFLREYFRIYETDKPAVSALYREVSTVSLNGTPTSGVEAIMQLHGNVPPVEHKVATTDAIPAGEKAALIVVTGKLKFEGQDALVGFAEVLLCSVDGEASYVHNQFVHLLG